MRVVGVCSRVLLLCFHCSSQYRRISFATVRGIGEALQDIVKAVCSSKKEGATGFELALTSFVLSLMSLPGLSLSLTYFHKLTYNHPVI
jgi:hypothetical protein